MPIVNNTYCQTFYKDSGTPVDASIQFCAGGQVVEHDSFTGKSLSEALVFASTNPQYNNRLVIELQVQYMKMASSEHGENVGRTCVEHVVCTNCLFFVLKFRTTYV